MTDDDTADDWLNLEALLWKSIWYHDSRSAFFGWWSKAGVVFGAIFMTASGAALVSDAAKWVTLALGCMASAFFITNEVLKFPDLARHHREMRRGFQTLDADRQTSKRTKVELARLWAEVSRVEALDLGPMRRVLWAMAHNARIRMLDAHPGWLVPLSGWQKRLAHVLDWRADDLGVSARQ